MKNNNDQYYQPAKIKSSQIISNNNNNNNNNNNQQIDKKHESHKKYNDSKQKKYITRESRDRNQKYTNIPITNNNVHPKQKILKLSEIDVKGNKTSRLEVQSPKSNTIFFKNSQKEK